MVNWLDIIALKELPPGNRHLVDIDGLGIIIFNIDGSLYALEDRCSHDDSPLHEGEIEGAEIICPWHGARFCIKTGEVTEPPAYEDIQTFPIRVSNGIVQINLD